MRIKNNTITGGTYAIMHYYGSYDTIANNTTTGSSYGAYVYGYTSAPYSKCNVIINNNFTASGYGIYCSYCDSTRIRYNTTTNGSGIALGHPVGSTGFALSSACSTKWSAWDSPLAVPRCALAEGRPGLALDKGYMILASCFLDALRSLNA
jgi:hypothetical protein